MDRTWTLSLAATFAAAGLALLVAFLVRKNKQASTAIVRRVSPSAGAITAPPEKMNQPTRVVFAADGKELISIVEADAHITRTAETVDANPALATAFEGILRQVPGLAQATMATQNYVLRFAPEILNGIRDGSLHLMNAVGGGNRAIAVDVAGQIAGHGTFVAAVPNPLLVVGVVWQAMAFITAQKFLASINQQLAQITNGIDDLKQWLESEQFTKLTGNLKYLRSIEEHLRHQDITREEWGHLINQLEDIEREAVQISEHRTTQMDHAAVELSRAFSGSRNMKATCTQARGALDSFRKASRGQLVACVVRLLSAQIRCAMPVNRAIAASRLRELPSHREPHRQKLRSFIEHVDVESEKMKKPWYRFKETLRTKQQDLRTDTRQMMREVEKMADQVFQAVDASAQDLQQSLDESERPAEFVVTVEGGNVTRISRVPLVIGSDQ